MKKFAAITLAAVTLIATSSFAEARGRHGHGHGHGHHGHRGHNILPWVAGAAALGVLGAGAYYYNTCRWHRQPVYNRWGDVVALRDVRVCD